MRGPRSGKVVAALAANCSPEGLGTQLAVLVDRPRRRAWPSPDILRRSRPRFRHVILAKRRRQCRLGQTARKLTGWIARDRSGAHRTPAGRRERETACTMRWPQLQNLHWSPQMEGEVEGCGFSVFFACRVPRLRRFKLTPCCGWSPAGGSAGS